MPSYDGVAVLVPCHNEARTIAIVVRGFEEHLPGARVVVCDNSSTDGTSEIARSVGARVISERNQGKGYAVRRLFADVDADYYVLVDGDATYDPSDAPEIVRLMKEGADTVLAVRVPESGGEMEFRRGHRFGNAVFSRTFSFLFATNYADVLTGYRGFSRRFVKSCPLLARGFDVEIELNVHAASLSVPTAEIESRYQDRPDGSHSKLNTYKDGARIFRRLFRLFRDYRPMLSFGAVSAILAVLGVALGIPVLLDYERSGLVLRFPTLFVVVGLLLGGGVSLLVGVILERSSRDRIERNRLAYLSFDPPTRYLRTREGNFDPALALED